jgi:AcrR family transcriptional regulator
MSLKLSFELPEKLFLKDPQHSEYGHRLLSNAIELINELGFERFTFKKLATKMSSSEVSIYRYFENKHLLLVYLNCWYWEWVTYLIDLKTINLDDAKLKLKRAIHCMIHAKTESTLSEYINENLLFQIIMKESSKTYHISSVDEVNKYGFFIPYKELVGRLANIIEEINPKFQYAKSLGSTLFEMINNQLFYAEHLPRLTSLNNKSRVEELEVMVNHFAFSVVND